MIELKGKHIYGVAALIAGSLAILGAGVSWLINQSFNTGIQAALAAGLIGLVLFAWLEIDLITRALGSRQARYGAESLAFIVCFLVFVGLINYLFAGIPRLKYEKDLTESQENSLAPETIKLLTELKEPVRVLGFYTQTSFSKASGEELLKKFRDKSGGTLDYQIVDPETQPLRAEQYKATDGTLVVVRGEQHQQARFADEASLVNAITRLENPVVDTIYFIQGHGEFSPDESGNEGLSQLKSYLESINYTVKTLGTLGTSVPVDATVMVIAGPTQPYTAAEVETLSKYLSGGGRAIILIEPSALGGVEAGQKDPLVDYLSQNWGITLRDDFVLDPAQYLASANPAYPAALKYGTSPIISPDIERVGSFFPSTRSIAQAEPGATPADVIVTSLVKTSQAAWGETNFDFLSTEGSQPAPEAGDAQGELTLAATAENTASKSRVVVFGDSEFGLNGYWNSPVANATLLVNSVKWLTEKSDLITLSPRNQVTRSLNLNSDSDLRVIGLLSCLLPPLLVIIGAIGMWWSRRQNA